MTYSYKYSIEYNFEREAPENQKIEVLTETEDPSMVQFVQSFLNFARASGFVIKVEDDDMFTSEVSSLLRGITE